MPKLPFSYYFSTSRWKSQGEISGLRENSIGDCFMLEFLFLFSKYFVWLNSWEDTFIGWLPHLVFFFFFGWSLIKLIMCHVGHLVFTGQRIFPFLWVSWHGMQNLSQIPEDPCLVANFRGCYPNFLQNLTILENFCTLVVATKIPMPLGFQFSMKTCLIPVAYLTEIRFKK